MTQTLATVVVRRRPLNPGPLVINSLAEATTQQGSDPFTPTDVQYKSELPRAFVRARYGVNQARRARGDPVNHFVCSISRLTRGNWDLCKEAGAYGLRGQRKRPTVSPGDSLFLYIGGEGFKAYMTATGVPRIPKDNSEAPWEGGTYEYGLILPFEIQVEVKRPLCLPFNGQRQEATGVSKALLQQSFGAVSDEGAGVIIKALRERFAEEQALG